MSFHMLNSETNQSEASELRKQEYERHSNGASFAGHRDLLQDCFKLYVSLENLESSTKTQVFCSP